MPRVAAGQCDWHGLAAWTLESELVRTVVVPQVGAKIVSLLDKRNGVEWLAAPGDRSLRPIAYGADFEKQDMSGWDEMFPTISACLHPGPGAHHAAALPDHGEVWALPWAVDETGAQLRLSVEGQALPYRLTRTMRFTAPDTLVLDYRLDNLHDDPLPYIWAAHPQFACGAGGEIHLPQEVTRVCNVLPPSYGWGEPETEYDWPHALRAEGRLYHMPSVHAPTQTAARKFYILPHQHIAGAGVVHRNESNAIRLAWDPAAVPYFGLWVDEGALNHQSVVTPEPTTGFYDSLERAWQKQQVLVLDAGATTAWALTVQLQCQHRG